MFTLGNVDPGGRRSGDLIAAWQQVHSLLIRDVASEGIVNVRPGFVAVVFASAFVLASIPSPAPGQVLEIATTVALTTERDSETREAAEAKLAVSAEANGALGLYYDRVADEMVVLLSETAASNAAPISAAGEALGLRVRVETNAIVQREIDSILERLTTSIAIEPDSKDAFGVFFDPRLAQVVVEGSVPPQVIDQLRAEFGDKIAFVRAEGSRLTRNADAAPHWGGAKIVSAGKGACSSGFTILKAGARRMVTAGHCSTAQGDAVVGGTGLAWGTVVQRGSFPAFDLEILGGSTYGPSIYVGDATGTGKTVSGATNPAVGSTNYCSSGISTNEQCNHNVTSLNGSFCDAAGCTTGVAVYSGGNLQTVGDSGSPFYRPGTTIGIRGVVFARSGNNVYVEKWSTVAALFSATIATP